MTKKIIWLASYPKSGNTWLRILLSHITETSKKPVAINNIPLQYASYGRGGFDELLGLETDLLTTTEEDRLRPIAFNSWAERLKYNPIVKVHEMYYKNIDDQPVFPSNATKSVIYIVRNPLDVAVSYANHGQISLDKSISRMSDEKWEMSGKRKNDYQSQLTQKLSTWSNHVLSWIDQKELDVLLVRYEDLHSNTLLTFKNILDFLTFEYSDQLVLKAIENSRFSNLQQMESSEGFREHRDKKVTFFWKGEPGNWKNYLSSAQEKKIIEDHRIVMKRLNYLDDNERPIF